MTCFTTTISISPKTTNGTGSRAIPTHIQTRAARARNRVVSMPIPYSTMHNNTVVHAVTVVAEQQVPEAGVTGVREEEIEQLRLRIVATAIILASLRDSAEIRIRRKG